MPWILFILHPAWRQRDPRPTVVARTLGWDPRFCSGCSLSLRLHPPADRPGGKGFPLFQRGMHQRYGWGWPNSDAPWRGRGASTATATRRRSRRSGAMAHYCPPYAPTPDCDSADIYSGRATSTQALSNRDHLTF
ncbi:hypothetical protein LNQ03_08375 [Klebsiella pneumoniae subsp. pneumoniae]|nr:hypothetical protein [Klebsiella pneumoniae subsp. pneumoniae]